MPTDLYTHDFVYRLGDGGSKYVIGEMEFNHDKKVSYRIKLWSEPMEHTLLEAFSQFVDRLKLRYDEFGSIKNVMIREKGYVEPE